MEGLREIGELLGPAVASLTADYHTQHVGVVTSVSSTSPVKVGVQLATSRPVPVEDGRGFTFEPYGDLDEVPVMFPGNATVFLRWKIAVGDPVMLHCVMHDPSTWLGTGVPGKPGLTRRSAMGYAFAVPSAGAGGPHVMLGDTADMMLEAPSIQLGALASMFLAKAAPLVAALDAFANAVPVPQDGGAAIHTAFKAAWTTNKPLVECTKVKGE